MPIETLPSDDEEAAAAAATAETAFGNENAKQQSGPTRTGHVPVRAYCKLSNFISLNEFPSWTDSLISVVQHIVH